MGGILGCIVRVTALRRLERQRVPCLFVVRILKRALALRKFVVEILQLTMLFLFLLFPPDLLLVDRVGLGGVHATGRLAFAAVVVAKCIFPSAAPTAAVVVALTCTFPSLGSNFPTSTRQFWRVLTQEQQKQ